MQDTILKNEEKAVFALRSLYKSYGYLPFKMNRFEEYELYVRNKDFLIGESVITFNDTNGKLLALKPDVTLSIIKNTVEEPGVKHKLFYNENVYRVSARTHQFKEIMQTGLECIGDIDITDLFEVVYLAARSLDAVSGDFILDISHMGLFSALLDEISMEKGTRKEITKLVSEKNLHEALALCRINSLGERAENIITALFNLYGKPDSVIEKLREICITEDELTAFNELYSLTSLLSATEYYDRIRLDFSVVNDMRYYDGIVFKGFLNGIFEAVLSGGRYDPLMRRMKRASSAIGFALYVDLLEDLNSEKVEYDVDVLLIYSDKTEAEKVINKKRELIEQGLSVCAMKAETRKIRYKRLLNLDMEV